jgi:hypothetical protein
MDSRMPNKKSVRMKWKEPILLKILNDKMNGYWTDPNYSRGYLKNDGG